MDQLTELLTRLARSVDLSRAPAVTDLQDRFQHGRLRVLLVGEAKRGKSTLGNAILRRQVLPEGVVPLTAVTTTVRQGTPERVDVHCIDGHLISAPIADLTLYVTETGNPSNQRGIDQVIVYLDSPLPHPSMELLDTPGVGSIHQHNTAMAETAMGAMDVAVFVVTMDPPISAAEVALLGRVRKLAARVYVVLNKIDQLEPADRSTAERFTRQVGADALQTEPDDVALFPVSARAAIRAAAAGDADGWAASGMAGFTRTLRQHLDSSWRTDLAVSIAGAARRLVTELL
ncbi:MAG: dynamin family protein, partial [Nakamurella sp.]